MIKSALQSSLTNDVKYSSMSAGTVPSSEYLIQTIITTASVSTIELDVSGLGTQFKHLYLILSTKTDRPAETEAISLRFNNDTGANYSFHSSENFANTLGSSAFASQTRIEVGSSGSSVSNYYPGGTLFIVDAFSSSKYKTTKRFQGAHFPTYPNVGIGSGSWRSNSPISTIKFQPILGTNFLVNSRISIYGVN